MLIYTFIRDITGTVLQNLVNYPSLLLQICSKKNKQKLICKHHAKLTSYVQLSSYEFVP